jgi:uncharacterized membrane protein
MNDFQKKNRKIYLSIGGKMIISGKNYLVSGLLVLSALILVNKLLLPTTIQIMVQDGSSTLKEIPNIYTINDSVIIAVSSFFLGICVFYLLSIKSELESTGAINQTSGSILMYSPVPGSNAGYEPEYKMENQPRNEPDKEKIESLLNLFKGNEQRILKELFHAGEINQAELAARADIPKSTLSRLLADLEKRGLVIRYENGMSKKVKLSDTLK